MPRFLTNEPIELTKDFLAEALDLIDIGILLLDRDMRVRLLNHRQAEMFGLSATLLASRPTFRDLLDHAAASSWFAIPDQELPEYLNQREAAIRAGAVPPTHIDLRDGTRLLFSCKVCSDGGRILTYADVSMEARPESIYAVEQINAELRFSNEILESHASDMAALAEATNESALEIEAARRELEGEIKERRLLESQLRRMATTDGLTGALNRVGFLELAQSELERVPRPGVHLAVLMLDIDHFKAINDCFGHAGGDQALKHLVAILGYAIRQGDLLGRLGGEEFAILLSVVALEDALRISERLVARVAESPATYDERRITMTVSVGLTTVTNTDHAIESVIARADRALYRAKAGGRNQVVTDYHGVDAA